MKRKNHLMSLKSKYSLLSLALLAFLTSCNGDDPLNPPLDGDMATYENFFYAQGYILLENMIDAERNKSYSITEYNAVSDDVDFIAYYTSADGFSISSPDNQSLKGLVNYSDYITTANQQLANNTQFRLSARADRVSYDSAANSADLRELFNSLQSSISDRIPRVKKDDVISFKTGEGNYGVFVVETNPSGSGGDASSVTLSIKIER